MCNQTLPFISLCPVQHFNFSNHLPASCAEFQRMRIQYPSSHSLSPFQHSTIFPHPFATAIESMSLRSCPPSPQLGGGLNWSIKARLVFRRSSSGLTTTRRHCQLPEIQNISTAGEEEAS